MFGTKISLILSPLLFAATAFGLSCPYDAFFREPAEYGRLGNGWPKVELTGLAVLDGETVALGVRPVSPFYTHAVAGKVSWSEVTPGYRVMKIESADGHTHYVDPQYVRSARRRDGQQRSAPELEKIASHERELVALDQGRLKKALCARRAEQKKDPSYDRLQSLIDKNYRNSAAMRNFLAARCGLSLAAFYPLRSAFRAYRAERRANDDRDVITEHGSNFVTGLLYMSVMHGCLASLTGDERRIFLTLTLGANVTGNVWEEIDIPGVPQKSLPMFTSAGNEVKTDLPDFAAGVLGTATYAVGTLILEKTLGLALSRLCL